jgi:hypothetical protein
MSIQRHPHRKPCLACATACIAFLAASAACAQAPDPAQLPPYQVQYHIDGGMRVFGSELKGVMQQLVDAFKKQQPDAQIGTVFMTSSEGAIAGLYTGISDIAPAGDDAKITDMMPFYTVFHYVPTEISIATGGWEERGTLWPAAIVVNKDNPLTKLDHGSAGADIRCRTYRRLGNRGPRSKLQSALHGEIRPRCVGQYT